MMDEVAWAKINLALHVRSRRADGYHDIETLFAFVDDGDHLSATLAPSDSLNITGPFSAALPCDENNLVLRMLRLLRGQFGEDRIPPLALALDKRLPVAAGLGGGSADAAALARLVRRHFLPQLSDTALIRLSLSLGADVGACIASQTCFGCGTGNELEPIAGGGFTQIPVLLVNPGLPVATGPVFAAWDGIDRGALFTGSMGRALLLGARNDLQRPATEQCPDIAAVQVALGEHGPWLARMSGSGATCFALFDAPVMRDAAERHLAHSHPHWWTMAGCLR